MASAKACCGHTAALLLPNPAVSPSPQGLVPRALLNKLCVHQSPSLSLLSGKSTATLPHCHLLPEYLRLREFFSHLFRSCLPSAAPPCHVLLSVTTHFAAGHFLELLCFLLGEASLEDSTCVKNHSFYCPMFSFPTISPTQAYKDISELVKYCRQLKAIATKYG